ncbi:MAG: hypothetical protein HFH12_12550 [Dorea sp.]|nr:hypothetical protein [Dorea sp.]
MLALGSLECCLALLPMGNALAPGGPCAEILAGRFDIYSAAIEQQIEAGAYS